MNFWNYIPFFLHITLPKFFAALYLSPLYLTALVVKKYSLCEWYYTLVCQSVIYPQHQFNIYLALVLCLPHHQYNAFLSTCSMSPSVPVFHQFKFSLSHSSIPPSEPVPCLPHQQFYVFSSFSSMSHIIRPNMIMYLWETLLFNAKNSCMVHCNKQDWKNGSLRVYLGMINFAWTKFGINQ